MFQKGHIVSDDVRRKISIASKGNTRGSGHHVSEANKLKLHLLKLGTRKPLSVRIKISRALKGVPLSPERAERQRRFIKMHFTGAGNHSWRGGVSLLHKTERQLAMQTAEYKTWRQQVFLRDGFTCVLGGKQHSVILNADHIKSWAEFPELRYVVSNGRTLCATCHRRTPSYGNRNKPYALSKQPQPAVVGAGNPIK